jgi:hypothetical protein
MNKTKMRVGVVIALFAIMMSVGAVAAHAQGVCHLHRELVSDLLHPEGHLVTYMGPVGPYTVWVPCNHWYSHWVTFCD